MLLNDMLLKTISKCGGIVCIINTDTETQYNLLIESNSDIKKVKRDLTTLFDDYELIPFQKAVMSDNLRINQGYSPATLDLFRYKNYIIFIHINSDELMYVSKDQKRILNSSMYFIRYIDAICKWIIEHAQKILCWKKCKTIPEYEFFDVGFGLSLPGLELDIRRDIDFPYDPKDNDMSYQSHHNWSDSSPKSKDDKEVLHAVALQGMLNGLTISERIKTIKIMKNIGLGCDKNVI